MIKERDGELNFRANKTEEYLGQFAELSPNKFSELKKKIEELNITRLKPEYVVKLADLMPESLNDIKVIMQAYPVTVKQEDLKKILAVIAEYKKK